MKKGQAILGNLVILIIFLVSIFVGGLLAAIVYYDMNLMQSSISSVNFQIPMTDNSTQVGYNITDFQDILGYTVYPVLGLSSALPYLTYFMIFGLVIALAMTAYVSSKNAVFFVIHLLFTLIISYFCIILSNTYDTMLKNPILNQMLVPFTIYNKIMLYLPQVVFFTSLLFAGIAFVNIMKPQSNDSGNSQSLNYGGDY